MTVPQSLLIVALALAWLVVLVPSSSRRRGHVREIVDGSGFRVLRRQDVKRRKVLRRDSPPRPNPADVANFNSEGQMSSQQTSVDSDQEGSVEVASAVAVKEAVADNNDPTIQLSQIDDEPTVALPKIDDEMTSATVGLGTADEPADSVDDSEVRAQYQAWRASTKASEPSAEDAVAPAGRPIPRRPGRGTYDPEAAEKARAYKYSRRRRTLLVLLLVTAAFTVTAVTISAKLWIGAAVAFVLLVLFMAYLRRQVKIEADIRERRLAKLERARQIRPERPQTADYVAGPYAQRAPGPSQVPGPGHSRSNRVVVDVDDDDPGFDDLEQYEPMVYRRAVGQ